MIFSFERTHDMDLVRRIITEPRGWAGSSDDFSPPPEAFIPLDSESIWYVLCWSALGESTRQLLGCWVFYPQNAICWEVHTCLLPAAYGSAGRAAAVCSKWMWQNSPCLRIVTTVPVNNRLALKLAGRAGMVEFGWNRASFMKNGQLIDQVLLGISKPSEAKCQ